MTAMDRIKPFAEGNDDVHVVIDRPRGSRNKLKWDRKLGVLKLSHVLTAGAGIQADSEARRGRGRQVNQERVCKSPKEKTLEVRGKATSTRSGPGTSKLGSSPYEVYDCKLACETKAATTSTTDVFRALGE